MPSQVNTKRAVSLAVLSAHAPGLVRCMQQATLGVDLQIRFVYAGLDQLSAIQIVGATSETLATFQQFGKDGGFAIPTADLGPFNTLLDEESTGLLFLDTESQMLHGVWKSTEIAYTGAEVHHLNGSATSNRMFTLSNKLKAQSVVWPITGRRWVSVLQTRGTVFCISVVYIPASAFSVQVLKAVLCVQRLMDFVVLEEVPPLYCDLVLDILQVHHAGNLKVPQAARGTRLEALKLLLRQQETPAPTPGSSAGSPLLIRMPHDHTL